MKALVQMLSAWGPGGLFFLAAFDSAGVPLPAAVDALLVAVAVVNPSVAWLSAALAVVGSCAGSLALFLVARKGGEAYWRRQKPSPRAARFRQWFQAYGLITVFIPVLVPIPLPVKVFVISAGALGASPLRFLAVVAAARIPRYCLLAYLGLRLGHGTMAWLRTNVWWLALFALLLALALGALVRFASRRAAGQDGSVQGA